MFRYWSPTLEAQRTYTKRLGLPLLSVWNLGSDSLGGSIAYGIFVLSNHEAGVHRKAPSFNAGLKKATRKARQCGQDIQMIIRRKPENSKQKTRELPRLPTLVEAVYSMNHMDRPSWETVSCGRPKQRKTAASANIIRDYIQIFPKFYEDFTTWEPCSEGGVNIHLMLESPTESVQKSSTKLFSGKDINHQNMAPNNGPPNTMVKSAPRGSQSIILWIAYSQAHRAQ